MAAPGEKSWPSVGTSDGRPRGGSHGRRQYGGAQSSWPSRSETTGVDSTVKAAVLYANSESSTSRASRSPTDIAAEAYCITTSFRVMLSFADGSGMIARFRIQLIVRLPRRERPAGPPSSLQLCSCCCWLAQRLGAPREVRREPNCGSGPYTRARLRVITDFVLGLRWTQWNPRRRKHTHTQRRREHFAIRRRRGTG